MIVFRLIACLIIAEYSVAAEPASGLSKNPDYPHSESIDSTIAPGSELDSPDTINNQKSDNKTLESIDSLLTLMDQSHLYISSNVNDLTKNIDAFFSDEKIDYETNGSYLRLTGDMILSENGETGFAGNAKIKIYLPNTRRRLKLVFESDPEQEREELEKKLQNTPVEAAKENSYFAGIEALWGEFQYWKFRPAIGLKVNSKLQIYTRFRANRLYNISQKWSAYLSNTAYHYNTSGYGFKSSLELDNKINDGLLFRSSSSAQWEEDTEFWELEQLFALTQAPDYKRAIIFQAGIFGVSEPRVWATDYLLQIRYRKLLHSKYLFLELSPKIVYPRDDDFEPAYSLTIRAEVVFKG